MIAHQSMAHLTTEPPCHTENSSAQTQMSRMKWNKEKTRKRIKKNAAPQNGMKNVFLLVRITRVRMVFGVFVAIKCIRLPVAWRRWWWWWCWWNTSLLSNGKWLLAESKVMQKNRIIHCAVAMLSICSRDIFRARHFSWMRGARVRVQMYIFCILACEEFYYYSCDAAIGGTSEWVVLSTHGSQCQRDLCRDA